jgi:predicted MFS family arabinose efflux permease
MFRPIRFIKDEYVQAYRGLPRRAWILFAVNLVNSSGSMVIFFLSLYLTRELGLTTARAGQALSLYGVGSLVGAYAGGWLADRIGSIAVQKMSLAMCGIALVALGQVRTMAGILPLLFAFAMFAGTLYPANATSMSKICPPGLQVKGFALNRLAGNLGATIGPAIGGFLALRDYRLLFWADGLTSLAAAAVFAVLWRGTRISAAADTAADVDAQAVPAPRSPQLETPTAAAAARAGEAVDGDAQARPHGHSPWRDKPFLAMLFIFFVWYAVFIQVLTTFPLYMRNVYGLAENRIGQLFAVNTIMIVAVEMILMERIRKYPQTRMINISFLLLGAGLGLMPLGRGFAYGALTVAVWTFGEMLSMPLITALISSRADDANRGRYMGMFSFIFSLAFIVAPAAGTAIYDRFGPDAVWYISAALCVLIAGAFSLLRPYLGSDQTKLL